MSKQRQTSNGMKKLVRFFRTQIPTGLFAAFVPLAEYKGTKLESLYTGDLTTYLNSVFFVAISVGAAIAVMRIAYAGFMYMGSDLWQNKIKVKEWLTDAFVGLFLLLSAYVVLFTINPNILKFEFLFPKIKTAGPVAGTTGAPAVSGKRLTVSAGACAPNQMFGGYASQMSCICAGESSGDPTNYSRKEMTAEGKPLMVGLYQINLSAHPIYCPGRKTLPCDKAFTGVYAPKNRNVSVKDEKLYNDCFAAAITKECNEATAQRILNNPKLKGLNEWGAWTGGNQSTCI